MLFLCDVSPSPSSPSDPVVVVVVVEPPPVPGGTCTTGSPLAWSFFKGIFKPIEPIEAIVATS